MPSGTVKWFNPEKGYGFIRPAEGGDDVFMHISALQSAGFETLPDGQPVTYELVTDRRGRVSAGEIALDGELIEAPARAPRPGGPRDFGDRPPRGPRPMGGRDDQRGYGGDRGFGDRSHGDRSYGDRGHGDRSHGDRGYGDRDRGFGDRGPRREGGFGDRPPRGPRREFVVERREDGGGPRGPRREGGYGGGRREHGDGPPGGGYGGGRRGDGDRDGPREFRDRPPRSHGGGPGGGPGGGHDGGRGFGGDRRPPREADFAPPPPSGDGEFDPFQNDRGQRRARGKEKSRDDDFDRKGRRWEDDEE